MTKTLNELAGDLKVLIIELNTDAHNKTNFRPERYNNLKLEMDVTKNPTPHVIISVAISSATYNLNTLEKMSGSLGADEKFVQRWFMKAKVGESLKEAWKQRVKNRGKISDVE